MSSVAQKCPQCGAPIPDPDGALTREAEGYAAPILDTGSYDRELLSTSSAFLPAHIPAEPDPVFSLHGAGGDVLGSAAAPAASEPRTADAIAAFDFSAPPRKPAPGPEIPGPGDGDDAEDGPGGPPPWALALLASYASAVTLALVWILVGDRTLARRGEENAPAEARPDPGTRSASARKIAPAAPIAAGDVTTIGRPLRVGDLELTPLEVSSRSITLTRQLLQGGTERRDGPRVLALRLRLVNRSADAVFAPLDESFVRDSDREVADSFIEGRDGVRHYLYPLPVHSEWSVVGEDFRDLKPGESYETEVVGDAVPDSLGPDATWRLRVRVGVGRTEAVGVRFSYNVP